MLHKQLAGRRTSLQYAVPYYFASHEECYVINYKQENFLMNKLLYQQADLIFS
jgi:hypothetical protein